MESAIILVLLPEIVGTQKKSQTINHNLPRKIVMIKLLLFIWPLDEGDDKIMYITNTNRFNRLFLVAFGKSIWEYMLSFIFLNRLSFMSFWNF